MKRYPGPMPFCAAILFATVWACSSGPSEHDADPGPDATIADVQDDGATGPDAPADTDDPDAHDVDVPGADTVADVDAPDANGPLAIPYITPPWGKPQVDQLFLQEDNSNTLLDTGLAPLIALATPGPGDSAPRRIAPRGLVMRTPEGQDSLLAIPEGDPDLVGGGIAGDALVLVGPRRIYALEDDALVPRDLELEGEDDVITVIGVVQGEGRLLAWTTNQLVPIANADDVAWHPLPLRPTAVLEADGRVLVAGTPNGAPDSAPQLIELAANALEAAPTPALDDGTVPSVGPVRALLTRVILPVPLDLVVIGDDGIQGFVGEDGGRPAPRDVPLFATDRVPLGAPTSAIRTSDGGFLVTTQKGAYRVMDRGIGPEWRVYNALRWVPDGDVRAAWTDPDLPDGPIWFATAGGQSSVTARRITLETKVAEQIDRIVTRHDRDGAIADSRLTIPGDLSTNIPWDSDNDGGWTCYWILAECFRYKATGDPEAKAHFDRSLERMLSFRTLTGTDWFVARSVIRKATCNLDDCDDPDDGEWFSSPDGEWWVKSDTSNDEVTSHMFMMAHAYELCADEGQRQAIREHVGGIVGGLVDHGFKLLKPDMVETTYGQFDPEYINNFAGLVGDGGRRSVQMLAALDLALALTGDLKFADAKRLLIDEHHYHENVVTESEAPGRRGSGDGDELGTQAFFVLLRYETDPDLYAMYKEGWRRTYGNMRLQQDALWDVVNGVLGGEAPSFENTMRWLRLAPTDGIRLSMNNIQRNDLVKPPDFYRVPNRIRWARSDGRILPGDERPNIRHNSSQFDAEGGWGSDREIDGADVVAAYWMARFHGFIVP